MARKLKERLGLVQTHVVEIKPELNVPPSDGAGALVEAAESGFAAIQALYADRNNSVQLAQTMHRETVYLRNVNNGLRAQLAHLQLERDYLMKANARLGAHLAQAQDLFGRIGSEIGQVTQIIEQMPPMPTVTNNPDAPPLSSTGLPIEDEQPAPFPHYDTNGVPDLDGVPIPDPDDLRQLAERVAASTNGRIS